MATGLIDVTHSGVNSPTPLSLEGAVGGTMLAFREHAVTLNYLDNYEQNSAYASYALFSGAYRTYENGTVEFEGSFRSSQIITGVSGNNWDLNHPLSVWVWVGTSPTVGRYQLIGYVSCLSTPTPCRAAFTTSAGEKVWWLCKYTHRVNSADLCDVAFPLPTYSEDFLFETSTVIDFQPSNGGLITVQRVGNNLNVSWSFTTTGSDYTFNLWSTGNDKQGFVADVGVFGGPGSGSFSKDLTYDEMYFYWSLATYGSNIPVFYVQFGFQNVGLPYEGSRPDPIGNLPEPEAIFWRTVAQRNGGTTTDAQFQIANNTVKALKAAGLFDKIYLLPLLGSDLPAAKVPLCNYDRLPWPVWTAFVNGDFTATTGLQGNGTTKYIRFPYKFQRIGSSYLFGLFWWELNYSGAGNVEAMGCYGSSDTNRYCLDLRPTLQAFRAGPPATNSAQDNTTATNGAYHGIRESISALKLLKNGVKIAEDTNLSAIAGADDQDIHAFGLKPTGSALPWPGRAGCIALTMNMSEAEAVTLYQILRDNLMIPTGRVAP
jgi:hypothetical protein